MLFLTKQSIDIFIYSYILSLIENEGFARLENLPELCVNQAGSTVPTSVLVNHDVIFAGHQGVAVAILSKPVYVRADSVGRTYQIFGTSLPAEWIIFVVSLDDAPTGIHPKVLRNQKRSTKTVPNTLCGNAAVRARLTDATDTVVAQTVACRVAHVIRFLAKCAANETGQADEADEAG